MEIPIHTADLTSGLMYDVTFAHNDLEKAPRKGKVCVLEMTHQGGQQVAPCDAVRVCRPAVYSLEQGYSTSGPSGLQLWTIVNYRVGLNYRNLFTNSSKNF